MLVGGSWPSHSALLDTSPFFLRHFWTRVSHWPKHTRHSACLLPFSSSPRSRALRRPDSPAKPERPKARNPPIPSVPSSRCPIPPGGGRRHPICGRHGSPAPPTAARQAPALPPTLTDELLEEIFLRLPTPADVARASAACPSFRCIITDRSFLRRFRAIHPPPLLGFAAYEGFHPAQPPHPSAPLARAFADFSYSFVPAGRWLTPWHPRDVRQGRVVLECIPDSDRHPAFEYYDTVLLRDLDLAVCDPLSRRYSLLPRIPKNRQHQHLIDFGLFLAPTGEVEDETAFRVVCVACNKTMVVVFEFTSITGEWHIPAYLSCSSLGTVMPNSRYSSSCHDNEQSRFYWMVPWRRKLLVLDVFSMDASMVNKDLATYHMPDCGKPLIALGEDRTPEVLFLADCYGDGPTKIIRITKQNDSGSSDAWQFANMIPLSTQYNYFTLGAADGFLFLRGILRDENSGYSSEDSSDNSAHLPAESPDVEYFSLDVNTRDCKKVCAMKQYFGYPPPLAKPTI